MNGKRGGVKSLLMKEIELCARLHKANMKEGKTWRLKSRSLWLNARDKNTT